MTDAINQYLTREGLTARNYLAYWYAVRRVAGAERVLDFGSGHSVLPAMLSLSGSHVTCFDRKPRVHRQLDIAASMGAQLDSTCWATEGRSQEALTRFGKFDAVTCCFAIEENPPDRQVEIVKQLAAILDTQGKLVIVGRFSFDQLDHHARLIVESGLELAGSMVFFRYEEDSPEGEWCAPEEARAIAYTLTQAHAL